MGPPGTVGRRLSPMTILRRTSALVCTALAALVTACATPGSAALPPPTAVTGLDGRLRDPFAGRDGRTLVLVFVDVDCPISNVYAPEVGRLATEYGPRGVDVELVYAVPDRDAATIRAHVAAYDYRVPVLLDPSQELVQRAGVTTTPEVAVFRADGRLAYRGRIDDRYQVLGARRAQASRHDLRVALDDLLAGRPIEVEFTPPIGCPIPPPDYGQRR